MVRVAIGHVILFIAIVGASALLVGVVVTQTALYSQAVDGESERDAATIDAEIEFISDPEAGAIYDEEDETVTLYVKNVGGDTLEPDAVSVLLDGEYTGEIDTSVIGPGVDVDGWRVGSTAQFVLEESLNPGDHRAVVEVDGARDVLEFEHRIAFWLEPEDEDGVEACENGACTVDLNESESVELTMVTEEPQDDELVEYAVNNTEIATVDPDEGVTDADGENSTTLDLHEEGDVSVELDTGWADDELVIRVIDSSEE